MGPSNIHVRMWEVRYLDGSSDGTEVSNCRHTRAAPVLAKNPPDTRNPEMSAHLVIP